jgi:Protein of unknown function (DUF1579)
MKSALRVMGMAVATIVMLVGHATAQDKKEVTPPKAAETPVSAPGQEQDLLKRDVGVWDLTIESTMEPGGKPNVTKATETNTLLGGRWLISDLKGELMGIPYHGHGVMGYDPAKKKYAGTWVDSMSTEISQLEGTYDPKTKTMTSWMESPGPDGKPMKMRSTSEWKDDDTRIFTMHSPAGKGDEFVMMKVIYKRHASK